MQYWRKRNLQQQLYTSRDEAICSRRGKNGRPSPFVDLIWLRDAFFFSPSVASGDFTPAPPFILIVWGVFSSRGRARNPEPQGHVTS